MRLFNVGMGDAPQGQLLAERRSGRAEPARQSLAQASQLIQSHLPNLASGQLGGTWHEWLMAEILRLEAAELIARLGEATTPKAKAVPTPKPERPRADKTKVDWHRFDFRTCCCRPACRLAMTSCDTQMLQFLAMVQYVVEGAIAWGDFEWEPPEFGHNSIERKVKPCRFHSPVLIAANRRASRTSTQVKRDPAAVAGRPSPFPAARAKHRFGLPRSLLARPPRA